MRWLFPESSGPTPKGCTTVATRAHDIAFELRLLDAVQAGIIATDLQGLILYWNPFAEELYGWSAQEVVGRNILEIAVAPENLQSGAEIMARLRSRRSIDYAYHRAVEFAERAKKPLSSFPPSAERDALLALPDYVLSRDR